jgi:hypothetical protein
MVSHTLLSPLATTSNSLELASLQKSRHNASTDCDGHATTNKPIQLASFSRVLTVRSVHLSIIANPIHKFHPSIHLYFFVPERCFRVQDGCAISHAKRWQEPPSTVLAGAAAVAADSGGAGCCCSECVPFHSVALVVAKGPPPSSCPMMGAFPCEVAAVTAVIRS